MGGGKNKGGKGGKPPASNAGNAGKGKGPTGKSSGPPLEPPICIRCPDPKAKEAKHQVVACPADAATPKLWPGFQDGIKDASPKWENGGDCAALLTTVQKDSDGAFLGGFNETGKLEAMLEYRSKSTYSRKLLKVTKPDLIHAFATFRESEQKQKQQKKMQDEEQARSSNANAAKCSDTTSPNPVTKLADPKFCGANNSHRDRVSAVTRQPAPVSLPDDIPQGLPRPSAHNQIAAFSGQHNKSQQERAALTSNEPSIALERAPKQYELRQGFNPRMTSGSVLSNHFIVNIGSGKRLYEYHIVDIPEKASRPKCRMLILDLMETNQKLWDNKDFLATDCKRKIISSKPLDGNSDTVPGTDIDTSRIDNYTPGTKDASKPIDLTIRLVNVHDLDGLRDFVSGRNEFYTDRGAADALNIVLAKAISSGHQQDVFQVGNNRFYYRPGWNDLKSDSTESKGTIAVRGYFSSIAPAMGAVLLNVNTVSTAFYKAQPLEQFCRSITGRNGADNALLTEMNKKMPKFRVRINFDRKHADNDPNINAEKRRIKTLAALGKKPDDQGGPQVNGRVKKVWDHIRDKYPKAVIDSDRNMPTANVGRNEPDKRNWYLASNLDIIADQVFRRQLTSSMTSDMIAFAKRNPAKNYYAILEEGRRSISLPATDPMLNDLGITVSNGMIQVPFVRLPSPKIRYAGGESFDAEFGYWKPNQNNPNMTFANDQRRPPKMPVARFYRPSKILHAELETGYIADFRALHTKQGLPQYDVPDQKCQIIQNWAVEGLKSVFKNCVSDTDLVVVIFPRNNASYRTMYQNFKFVMDKVYGLKSICFCEESMVKSKSSKSDDDKNSRNGAGRDTGLEDYMRNICMKINLRLGNHNHEVNLPVIGQESKCNTIVLGADVTHPSAGTIAGTPSVAAVVGSLDNKFARFPGSMRLNTQRQDIIDDMKDMVKERLSDWQSVNGKDKLPQNILFYRDGVGESRYAELRTTEVLRIKAAWEEKFYAIHQRKPDPKEQVKLTVVVVTKRHHTRFYPTDILARQGSMRHMSRNCPPGTLVDSGVTSPYYFDFFLLSHSGGGTLRPAHYFVLENGMNFSTADLQLLTFQLCFTYGRSLTSVSYAPPAYYADRLCERGRLFLKPFFDGEEKMKEMSEEDVWREAERVFYGTGSGGVGAGRVEKRNPWHANHDMTMFWM